MRNNSLTTKSIGLAGTGKENDEYRFLKHQLSISGSGDSSRKLPELIREIELRKSELEVQNRELRHVSTMVRVAVDKFTEFYDFTPSGYFKLSAEGKILEMNLWGSQMLRGRHLRLRNTRFERFVSRETRQVYLNFFTEIHNNSDKQSCEVTLYATGSEPMQVLLTGIATGSEGMCILSVVDISAQKRAETAMRENAERYRILTQSANDAIVTIDRQGVISGWNNKAVKMFGYPEKEILGKEVALIIPEDQRAAYSSAIERAGIPRDASGMGTTVELSLRDKKHHIFPVELSLSEWQITSGLFFTAIIRDISERKRAEQDMLLHELRLQQLLELHQMTGASSQQILDFAGEAISKSLQSPYAFIGLLDDSETIITMHAWSAEFFRHAAINQKPLVLPVTGPGIWGMAALKKKEIILNKYSADPGDNQEYPSVRVPIRRFAAIPVFSGNKIIAVAAAANKGYDYSAVDLKAISTIASTTWGILRRKRIEDEVRRLNETLEARIAARTDQLVKFNAALLKSEERFRMIADHTYDWEYWIDARGNYNYISPSCERITGYSVFEFTEDTGLVRKIIHPADLVNFIRCYEQQSVENKVYETEFRIITKTGQERWISHLCRKIYIDGSYMGIRVSNRDITEKVKTENELLNLTAEVEERERNNFSRELHDGLGPLLSTIKLYFQWLAESDDVEKTKIISEKGGRAIEKAIQTTREVTRGFSSLVLSNFGFVQAVIHFVRMINDTKKLNIKFFYNTQSRFSNIVEISLYRITTELINNTLNYSGAGEAEIIFSYLKEQNQILYAYSDNGTGFDTGSVSRSGNGFGLMHIQQRILNLKGDIKIESSPGNGMKVKIELKVSETIAMM